MANRTSSSLVPVTEEAFNVTLSLAYATEDNFTGHTLYASPACYLHETAAEGLHRAVELLAPLHLKLKIWDGFRPLSIQQALYNHLPDPNYVSPPESGVCPHCRGIALDLTIIDRFDHELDMGTSFDDFRPLAHHGNDQVSEEAQRNRLLLAGVMNIAGFEPLDTEWWHYQLPEARNYPIIETGDIPKGLTEQ